MDYSLEDAARELTRRGLGSEVARALDTWSDECRETKNFDEAERLLDLAHLVDPDPERAHLREAMFARDLDELRFLATSGLEELSQLGVSGPPVVRFKLVHFGGS